MNHPLIRRFFLSASILCLCVCTASIATAADEKASPESAQTKSMATATRIYEQAQPKPIGALPAGWRLVPLKGHAIKQQPTTLTNGESTTITTSAYVLLPEDKPGVLTFVDPGFDPALGNAQKNTIGAVLTEHIESAATMTQRMDTAISALKQALQNSAAAPTPQKQSAPTSAVKRTTALAKTQPTPDNGQP